MRKVVGNGKHTLVWHGGWSGAVQFPHLYAKAKIDILLLLKFGIMAILKFH